MIAKAIEYSAEIAGYVADGMRSRTDAEVVSILAICKDCNLRGKPLHIDGQCLVCGCKVNDEQNPLLNKARMASAHCPLKKW